MFSSAKNSEGTSSTCVIKGPENEVFIKNFGPLVEGVQRTGESDFNGLGGGGGKITII